MKSIEARKELYSLIITNNLTRYIEGIDIYTCSLEDIKVVKRNLAKKYHPDLNPNLSNKDIELYKQINGLLATIIVQERNIEPKTKTNSPKNDAKRTSTNANQQKENFRNLVYTLTNKYKYYGDYYLLEREIDRIIKSFINSHIMSNNFQTSTIYDELLKDIDNLFKEHFLKVFAVDVSEKFSNHEYYQYLIKYISEEIKKQINRMSRTGYKDINMYQNELNNNINKKITLITVLSRKLEELKEKIYSTSSIVKSNPKYQSIKEEFERLSSSYLSIDDLETRLRELDSLSKKFYDNLIIFTKLKDNAKNRNLSIYVLKDISMKRHDDGFRLLNINEKPLELINPGLGFKGDFSRTTTISSFELSRYYVLLREYLKQFVFIGKKVASIKVGYTVNDLLNQNIYYYQTLLYMSKDKQTGLFLQEDEKNHKRFYLESTKIIDHLVEDYVPFQSGQRYQNTDILIQDIKSSLIQRLTKLDQNEKTSTISSRLSN